MELLDEEFTSETLHHALALIDASDPSSSSDEQQPASSYSPEPDPFAHQQPVQTQSSTARKRHSAKSELERLRHDVQTLEKRLARLKSKSLRSNRATPAPDATSTAVTVASQLVADRASNEMQALWMCLAVTQQCRRQHSEATNRQLKQSIAKQLKVAKYLEALIARRTLVEDQEASYDPCMSDFRHFQNHSQDDELVFAYLLIHSQQLYATADLVEQAGLQLVNSMAAQMQRKQDPMKGTIFETVACSSVPFSVQQTDDVFGMASSNGKPGTNRMSMYNYVITEDGVRKNYQRTYQLLSNSFDLHSRTAMRKYIESNRIVYTWTTVTVLGVKGLRFLAEAMVITEPSPTLPQNASVVKKWLRLHGEQTDPSKLSALDAEPLIEGLLKTLGNETKATWSWLENNLLGGTNVVRLVQTVENQVRTCT